MYTVVCKIFYLVYECLEFEDVVHHFPSFCKIHMFRRNRKRTFQLTKLYKDFDSRANKSTDACAVFEKDLTHTRQKIHNNFPLNLDSKQIFRKQIMQLKRYPNLWKRIVKT